MSGLIKFFASGFGSGYVPRAPGTAGSVVGLGLAFVLHGLSGGHRFYYLLATVVISLVAIPIATAAERIYGQKDCPKIVIDEIAGILATFLMVPLTWLTVPIGFVLFRLFDIWKPYPIKKLQDLPGGWGIVLDDLLAGGYALLSFVFISLFFHV